MSDSFELQGIEGDVDSPERILYGEPGHLPDVDEDNRRGYIFDIGKHNPSKKARLDVEVSEVTFSDAYEAMENDDFEEFMSGTAVSSSMYGEEFEPEEVAEDLVTQIERYGLEGGAEPPEGYEVTVSNPE
ncbi:MAG: hypothetical protein ABEJ87_02580 [Candidatus Nanohalobium sp.]